MKSKASKADYAWSKPSTIACGACHDGLVSSGGMNHASIGLSSTFQDGTCDNCHKTGGVSDVKVAHQTENITKNNPTIADGLATFKYEIASAEVNATTNDLTIKFKITKAISPSTTATAVTFQAPAANKTTSLDGFTGGPSFLLAYAMPQDGIAEPAEYNNAGNAQNQGQPRSVSIANLLSTNNTANPNGANGSISATPDAAGYYTATIKGNGAWAIPVGAKMRAVALQGYYSQVVPAPAPAVARHAISVVKGVTQGGKPDTVRRTVVDSAKCANCHEWFEGHGGNRVYDVQVCVTCHNPSLATSGRGIPDSTLSNWVFDATSLKILADWGFDKSKTNAALNFPVTSNNMKDMIHGIHAGRDRVMPFMDARDRTSVTNGVVGGVIQLLDFRRMGFPGTLSNCEGCHTSTPSTEKKTYNWVPLNSLVSTQELIDATYAAAIESKTATTVMAKNSLKQINATDSVTTPFTASCVSCHDNPISKAHMTVGDGNGLINAPRTSVVKVENCTTCHGYGKAFDAAVMHK